MKLGNLKHFYRMNDVRIILFGVISTFLLSSCANNEEQDPSKPSFKPAIGVEMYEVKRMFDTGLSFDTVGFVQLAEWRLQFVSEDSVQVYSPSKDEMLGYKIYHDHDSFFHFARESWKVIAVHRDSLLFQRLSLNGLKVDRIRSNVYMKFYSKDYLDKVVKKPIEELRKPSSADTAFLMERIARSNRNPTLADSAIASQQFAVVESMQPHVTVEKRKVTQTDFTERTPAYEYLYPEYIVRIDKAYRNFNFDFSVVVDSAGNLHLNEVYMREELKENSDNFVRGLIDGYLKLGIKVTPATTLGRPHGSVIYLYVKAKQ
jgi:hypothetical protein